MQPSPTILLGAAAVNERHNWLSIATILVILAWLLPAPAHGAPQPPVPVVAPPAQTAQQATGLASSVSLMARELTSHLADSNPQAGELADGLAVCSFVDLKKLTRTSSFGRYLAEQLMSEFQQRGYTVVEMRKSTSLMIQEKRGEYALSRNPEDLQPSVSAGAVLTGTYTLAGENILVNAKIIDNRKSTMLASATLIFPRNQLAATLLADRASAQTGERDVVYMKRLEL
ncbi:MAG: FlgO family outer membrane protein [Desulfobulbaceae bacterium]|nr:FlgO family outer membrane protein [Desulfobulbaceae bacterium]